MSSGELGCIWVATTVNTRFLDSTARDYLSLIPPDPHRVRATYCRWPEGTGRVPVLAGPTEGESGLSRLLSALTGGFCPIRWPWFHGTRSGPTASHPVSPGMIRFRYDG